MTRQAGCGSKLPRLHRVRDIAGVASLLLALWLQALAPAVASRVHAASALRLDPALCGPNAGDGAAALPNQEPGCAPCPFCSPVATPTLTLPAGAVRRPSWRFAAWPLPPRSVSRAEPRQDGRPRAPPALA